MPRVTFPNGQFIDFPDETPHEEMKRVSGDFWAKQSSQAIDASQAAPAPVGEMADPLPQPEAQTASQGPPGQPEGIPVNAPQEGPYNLDVLPPVTPGKETLRRDPDAGLVGQTGRFLSDIGSAVSQGFLGMGQGLEQIFGMIQAGGNPALKQIAEEQGPEAALAAYQQQYQAPITDKYQGAEQFKNSAFGSPGFMIDEDVKRSNPMKWLALQGGELAAHMAPYIALNPAMPAHAVARAQMEKVSAEVAAKLAAREITEKQAAQMIRNAGAGLKPLLADAAGFGAFEGTSELARTGDPVAAAAAGAGTAAGVAGLGLFGRGMRDIVGALRGRGLSVEGATKTAIQGKRVLVDMHPDRATGPRDAQFRTEFSKAYNEAASQGDWKTLDKLDKQWQQYMEGKGELGEVARTEAQQSRKRLPEKGAGKPPAADEFTDAPIGRRGGERRGPERRSDVFTDEVRQAFGEADARLSAEERRSTDRRESKDFYSEPEVGKTEAEKVSSDKAAELRLGALKSAAEGMEKRLKEDKPEKHDSVERLGAIKKAIAEIESQKAKPDTPESNIKAKDAEITRKELQKKAEKEPWTVTRDDFLGLGNEATRDMRTRHHRGHVERALREGKDVPAEVLKDYPDLAVKSGTVLSDADRPAPKPRETEPVAEETKPKFEGRIQGYPEIVESAKKDRAALPEHLESAMSRSERGIYEGQSTPIDRQVAKGSELYDAFERTRTLLRETFGDTITLYRAEHIDPADRNLPPEEKTTLNYASKEQAELFLDEQYGKREIVSKEVPVDDIIAVNVGTKGRYEEFIVANKPTEAPTEDAPTESPLDEIATGPADLTPEERAAIGLKPTVERIPNKSAEKLRNQAKTLRDKAEASLAQDRETHTARKAKFAQAAFEQAEADKAFADTLDAVADRIDEGIDSKLSKITSKAQLESLESVLKRAQTNRARKLDKRYHEYKDESPTIEDASEAEYPWVKVSGNQASRVHEILTKQGKKALARRWASIGSKTTGDNTATIKDLGLLSDTVKALKAAKNDPFYFADDVALVKRLQKLGINDQSQLRDALSELVSIRSQAKGISASKKAELDLAGQKIPGFFPTPPTVIEKMMDAADIQPTDRVLEPSAGKGDIVEAVQAKGPKSVKAYEINSQLAEILEGKGIDTERGDFLGMVFGGYNKIVMNPPFENGQDIDHVKHAYEGLADGGRLVAIMSEGSFSRKWAKEAKFRGWLEEVGGTSEKLPEGSFKEHKLRKTGAATRMVIIDKPGEAPAESQAEDLSALSDAELEREIRKWESNAEEAGGMAGNEEYRVEANARLDALEAEVRRRQSESAEAPAEAPAGEDTASKIEMLEDVIKTRRENGEDIPQKWLDDLAKLKGQEVGEGEIAPAAVFGHPEATTVGGGKFSNLIPLKVSDVETIDKRIAWTQEHIDKLQSRLVKRKGVKPLTVEEETILELLRDETMKELQRVRRLMREDGKESSPTEASAGEDTDRSDAIAEAKARLDELQKKYEKKIEEDDPRVPPSIKTDALDSIVKEMDRLDKFIEEAEGSAGDADADFTLTDELIEAEAKAVTGSGGQLLIKFPKGHPPSKELKAAMKAAGIVWNRVHRAYLAKASSDDAVKVFGELEDSAKDAEPEPVEEKITKPLPTNPEKQRKELERINDEIQRLHTRANNTSLRSQKEAALDKIEELKKRRGKIFDLQNEAEAKAAEATGIVTKENIRDALGKMADRFEGAGPMSDSDIIEIIGNGSHDVGARRLSGKRLVAAIREAYGVPDPYASDKVDIEFTPENVYRIDDVGDYNTNLNPALSTGKDAGHNAAYGFSKAQRLWIRKALEDNFKDYRENSDKVAMQLVVPDDGTLTFDTPTALSLYKTLASSGEKTTLSKEAEKDHGKPEKMSGFSQPGPRVKYTPPRIPKAKPIPYDWRKADIPNGRLFEDHNIAGNEHFIVVRSALDKPGKRVNERLKGHKTGLNSLGKKIEQPHISKTGTDRLVKVAKSGKDVIEVVRWDWDMNRLNRGEGKTLPPVPVLRVRGGEILDVSLKGEYLDFLYDATGFTEIRGDMTDHADGPWGLWRKPATGKAVFVGAIMPNREGSTMKAQGSTAPKSDPRETVDVETGGEGGFLDFSSDKPVRKTQIEKKWLTDERARGGGEEVEDFFGRTKRMPKKNKLSEFLDKSMSGLRKGFVFLPNIPRTAETALARERIRHIQDIPLHATRQSIEDVKGYLSNVTDPTTDHIDPAGVEIVMRKLVLEDMKSEIERAKKEAADYIEENPEATIDKVHAILKGRAPLTEKVLTEELNRVNEIVDKVPSVKAAYERRQKLWKRITRSLVDRGVIPDESLDNEHYFRHFVMHYLGDAPGKPGTGKKLKDPYRGYARRREGTSSDWLTNLIEVETRALADIYKDNMIQDVAEEIADHYDEKKGLKLIVRERNYTAIVGGPENRRELDALRGEKRALQEQGELDAEDKKRLTDIGARIWKLDPTMPMRTKIAMGVEKIAEAWGLEKDEGGDWLDDLIEENAYGEEVHAIFGRLGELMNDPNPEVRMGAATILKGINERLKLIKDTLGKDRWTIDRVAAEKGLAIWNFQRDNIYYRTRSITNGQIAKMMEALIADSGEALAKELMIPESKLRDTLAFAGKRKEFYVPQWLADQLNDLPKQTFDQVIPVVRQAVMTWKRWILTTNPIRYNSRNFLGDSEGMYGAYGLKPFKGIPSATKMLAKGESPNEFPKAFEKARQFGVIETTMQYEFGELNRLEDFRGFDDMTDVSTINQVMDSFLGLKPAYKGLQRLTQFREDILRYTLYLHALKEHKAGNFSHKAGRLGGVEDIKALHRIDPYMAAAKVSREALGDYGSFTNFENKALRQGIMPFYSWLKINTLRWPRIVGNTWHEAKSAGEGAAGTAKAGLAVGSLMARLMAPYAALILYNQRDDEARKRETAVIANSPWLAGLPHLTLDGGVVYTTSALSDFVEWFAVDEFVSLMHKYERGQISFAEMVTRAGLHQFREPINRVYQAMNPFMKGAIRVSTGTTGFPDVFEPRQHYDAWTDKAFADAFLSVLGADVKKALQTAKGQMTVKDLLAYYFSGAAYRPLDEEQLIDRLLTSMAWATLKGPSKKTGRGRYEAKAGREDDWDRVKEGLKALGYSEREIEDRLDEYWELQKSKKANGGE